MTPCTCRLDLQQLEHVDRTPDMGRASSMGGASRGHRGGHPVAPTDRLTSQLDALSSMVTCRSRHCSLFCRPMSVLASSRCLTDPRLTDCYISAVFCQLCEQLLCDGVRLGDYDRSLRLSRRYILRRFRLNADLHDTVIGGTSNIDR